MVLRYVLLGGRYGPMPPPLIQALGGACVAAALGLILITWGSPFFYLREIEALAMGTVGAALLLVGLRRPGPPPPG